MDIKEVSSLLRDIRKALFLAGHEGRPFHLEESHMSKIYHDMIAEKDRRKKENPELVKKLHEAYLYGLDSVEFDIEDEAFLSLYALVDQIVSRLATHNMMKWPYSSPNGIDIFMKNVKKKENNQRIVDFFKEDRKSLFPICY